MLRQWQPSCGAGMSSCSKQRPKCWISSGRSPITKIRILVKRPCDVSFLAVSTGRGKEMQHSCQLQTGEIRHGRARLVREHGRPRRERLVHRRKRAGHGRVALRHPTECKRRRQHRLGVGHLFSFGGGWLLAVAAVESGIKLTRFFSLSERG